MSQPRDVARQEALTRRTPDLRASAAARPRRGSGPLAALVGLAVLVPCFVHGGYTGTSRALFDVLAGAALLAAIGTDDAQARTFLRAPVVLALCTLAVLSLMSAAWTLAEPVTALRAGSTVVGLACLTTAAGVLVTRPDGRRWCALVILVVAAATALAGIVALALHDGPWAERISRRWRPEGPFEYPPALAFVQAAALPAYLLAMSRATRWAPIAAAGGALATATLVLAGSRTAFAIGVVALLLVPALPERFSGVRRVTAAAAIGLLVIAAAAAYGVGRVAAHGADHERLLGFAVVVGLAGGAWWRVEGRANRLSAPRIRRPAALATLATLVVLGIGLAATAGQGGLAPANGFAHGRTHIWRAAAETIADHPIVGAGADAFLVASRPHQGAHPTRYAHDLPIELAAELGIAGGLIAIALYASVGLAAWRAVRVEGGIAFGVPAVGFLAVNLVDWEWHLAGVAAVAAIGLGATLGCVTTPSRSGESGETARATVSSHAQRPRPRRLAGA